eukprot:COSAG01_NODE_1004_length_12197_cov_8.942718_6_plen_329_part_00
MALVQLAAAACMVGSGCASPADGSGPTMLPVQRHVGRWTTAPTMTPGTGNVIDGPLIGNGDAGAALASARAETLDFYLGKGDFWADAVDYHWGYVYMHLAAGHLSVSTAAPGGGSSDCLGADDGQPTAATASWAGMQGPASEYGCSSAAHCSPLGLLLTDTFFGTTDASFVVTSVPFSTFDVIVYYRMNEQHSFNISSPQCASGRTPTTVRPLASVNGTFVSAAYPSPSNYVQLSGCAGTNLTVTFTAGGDQKNHRKSLAALQIVEVRATHHHRTAAYSATDQALGPQGTGLEGSSLHSHWALAVHINRPRVREGHASPRLLGAGPSD